eukprot:TRINITY_DN4175_c0_g1_i12.p1 TRINITY_DN4175_c0_g1~~TRINITY_DN4175_c0_g1_i12.p1  ORF type:complete len:194 (-),score=33.41 TRINITY_DN4175_c0_g1_i12:633-1214(-)
MLPEAGKVPPEEIFGVWVRGKKMLRKGKLMSMFLESVPFPLYRNVWFWSMRWLLQWIRRIKNRMVVTVVSGGPVFASEKKKMTDFSGISFRTIKQELMDCSFKLCVLCEPCVSVALTLQDLRASIPKFVKVATAVLAGETKDKSKLTKSKEKVEKHLNMYSQQTLPSHKTSLLPPSPQGIPLSLLHNHVPKNK